MARIIRLIALGFLGVLVGLEIIFQILPVTTGLGYQKTIQAEPVLRTTSSFVKHSIDWKFHQAQTRKVNNYGFPDDLNYSSNTHPIAVIGDSYIQSLMLPYADTLQGQLGTMLQPQDHPVYSFGVPGYSLAGYIGSAEYASKVFQPEQFIFLLTNGDITDSLSTETSGSYFLNSNNLAIEFEPNKSSKINQFLLQSALIRYLILHLQFTPDAVLKFDNYQSAHLVKRSPDIDQLSTRLLDYLEQKSTVRPDNTTFIIDCDRDKIYQRQPQPQTSPGNQLTVFAQIARDRGYHTIDTLPIFTREYQKSHRRLDFKPLDIHWNRQAHQLVAEAVYPVIKTKLERIATR
jgi:hypothetical protein